MRKIATVIALFASCLYLSAGELQWETKFEKAREIAKKENKSILINFTGSDWCGWCKRLKREVFRKEEFADFVNKELVLLEVDFPQYKKLSSAQRKANASLAKKYGVMGYPTIFIVDAEGKELLRTGYLPGGVKSYIDHLRPYVKDS